MGRDTHSILQQTIGWLEHDFLTIVSKGGNLEKQTELTLQSVKNFLSGYKVEPDLLNNFIDVDYKGHLVEMRKRKLQKVMQRGESGGSSASDRKYDSENLEDEMSKKEELSKHDLENEEDEVGELVDTSEDKSQDDQKAEIATIPEKDSGDRNLEIVALLKDKVKPKKPKKRKIDEDIYERQDKRAKEKKVSIETEQKSSDVKDPKKKTKDKKKKKKRSKNIIDDIFDGF